MLAGRKIAFMLAEGIGAGTSAVAVAAGNLAGSVQTNLGSSGRLGAPTVAASTSSTSTTTRNYTINTYGTALDPNEIGAALRRMELVYG